MRQTYGGLTGVRPYESSRFIEYKTENAEIPRARFGIPKDTNDHHVQCLESRHRQIRYPTVRRDDSGQRPRPDHHRRGTRSRPGDDAGSGPRRHPRGGYGGPRARRDRVDRGRGRRKHGPSVLADVTREVDAERVVAAALERFGRVDILVNNAGRDMRYVRETSMTEPTRFWEVEPNTWRMLFDTNVNGPFLMARAATPHMARGGGAES